MVPKNRDHLVEELQAEVKRLEAENEDLRREVERLDEELAECEEHNILSYSGED